MIIAQVAVAVLLLPIAIGLSFDSFWKAVKPPLVSDKFLVAPLQLDRDDASPGTEALDSASATRFVHLQDELFRRLERERGIANVQLMKAIPGAELNYPVEVDRALNSYGADTFGTGSTNIAVNNVDPGFFDAFDVPILAGRGFTAADLAEGSNAVIVNQAFIRKVLGGSLALGRRIRYGRDPGKPGPWFEIVGIVPDFPATANPKEAMSRLYHPLDRHIAYPAILAIRARSGSEDISERIGVVATAVDPMLRFGRIATLETITNEDNAIERFLTTVVGLIAVTAVLLSAAGIHALLSVTVEQRRREIGIRIALGADRRRILVSIMGRALTQLVGGVVAGLVPYVLGNLLSSDGGIGEHTSIIVSSVAALMITVGLLAALGPTRRGLRISPTEALKNND